MIKYFGIRHHGSGSCLRLQKALENYAPDLIAIEGVAETDALISYLREQGEAFTPPVAMLLYNPKDFSQAVYYPFAEFSPEWQAMRYAARNGVSVAQIDLPQSVRFAIDAAEKEVKAKAEAAKEQNEAADTDSEEIDNKNIESKNIANRNSANRNIENPIAADPIGAMAALAGYSDGERWWEAMFEQYDDDALFETISEMMKTLRQQIPNEDERPMNLLREAYMRQQIRKIEKEGHQRIAVICGAYHLPALDLSLFPVKEDTALLKPYSKVKNILQATWIPWTYARLSNSSGYGAGVESPAWYGFLYQNPKMATIHWLSRVAVALRAADLDCSSAHIIEAVRLAETLASIRGLALPTLMELNEATISVLLNGDAQKLDLIIQPLIIGNQIGSIPDTVPQLPLQQDISALIKQLKLTKYLSESGWIKKSAASLQGGLDLRQAHDREQSQCLHRLNMLGIHWGTLSANTGREQSTKNEYWQMKWAPDYSLLIIEASIWGNTLVQAAAAATIDRARRCGQLPELAKMLGQALKANLPTAFEEILLQIQNIAALNKDVDSLMEMLPELVQVSRYGDVRQTDTSLVAQIIEQTTPRICILLPNSCIAISQEAAINLQKHIVAAHRALLLYQNIGLVEAWYSSLKTICESSATTQAYLKGLTTRLLFDCQQLSGQQTAELMQFALSQGQREQDTALWIEGFLFSSGLLLLHNDSLWQILQNWLASLSTNIFVALLPILRRSFAKFAPSERQKMLARASENPDEQPKQKAATHWNEQRRALIQPLLQKALG
jgi:hypothetical protein